MSLFGDRVELLFFFWGGGGGGQLAFWGGGRGVQYKKRESPDFRSPGVAISADC